MLVIQATDDAVITLDAPSRNGGPRMMRVDRQIRDVGEFSGPLVSIPGDAGGGKYTLAAAFRMSDHDTAELKRNL